MTRGHQPPRSSKTFAAPAGAAKAKKDNPNSLSNPLQIQPVLWYKERGPPQIGYSAISKLDVALLLNFKYVKLQWKRIAHTRQNESCTETLEL